MRNGSGVYSLPNAPVVPGAIISASQFNSTMNDIANALSQSLSANGETPITGSIKFPDGSASAPSIVFNSEASTGIFRPTPVSWAISILGYEKMRIHDNNLLIGTTTDTGEKLQVEGTAKIGNTLEVMGTQVFHGDLDHRGNIAADGLIFTLADVVANNNILAGGDSVGLKFKSSGLGSYVQPSYTFQFYTNTGLYSDDGASLSITTGGAKSAKFTATSAEVNDNLVINGTGSASAILEIGKDRTTSAYAILRMRATGTGAVNPTYDFSIIRASGDNGTVQYVNQGTGRHQWNTASSEFRYITTSTTTANNYTAATTAPDNGAYCTALTSAGSYQLMFKNAALTQSLVPYAITRSATGGVSSQVWKVAGDITTSAGSLETFRITDTNRFLIGNAADAIWSGDTTDVSTSYYFHGAKLGGGSGSISMGSEASFDSNLSFGRNNTNTKRVIYGQVVGNMSSSAAGAESGQLYLKTKDAADAATVTRMTINGAGATYTVPVVAPVGTEAAPTFTFTGDTDTGMYHSSANQLDFSTGGVRRLNIDTAGRLYAYSTGGDLLNLNSTVNNGLMQITATTGTANINNFAWYLTSTGSAILLLRNDAKTAYVSPITVQRNATSGTSNISFRVGGDSNVSSSDIEAGRFVVSTDGTQGKLLVGHTAQDIYMNNADVSPTQNFQIHSYKTSGNGPVSLLGTDGTNTSFWASSRTNTASKRVVQTSIGGVSVSNTAGAEKGRLELSTKAAADAATVVRATIDETAAAFTVPVTAPNVSYITKTVSTSAITQDGIYSTAAGFTLNTTDCAAGKIFTVYNNSAASIVITQGAGLTMRLSGSATTGSRTLAQRGIATFTCISSTEVICEGTT